MSHTFILREVQALRRHGVDVQTFTVRRTPDAGLLSDLDRDEASRTHHLLPTHATTLMRALARLLSKGGAPALVGAAREAWRMRRPGLRGGIWALFYLAEAVLLWAECERLSVSHVHAHFANVAADVALLTAHLGAAVGCGPQTWSFTMHGPAEFWAAENYRLADKVGSARFVACISDFSRSQLMGLTTPDVWPRLHVVHCGLDFRSVAEDAASPQQAAGTSARLVTVGRLVPVKGQILIVDAVAELRARNLDVTAEIIGEGPAREDLERRIHAHGLAGIVDLSGALGQDQVPDRVRAATVFLLPSFAEGVPVVAMEAMALGVPVITSRIAGIPELIEDGVSGLLVTPARLDELVDATERLLRDAQLRARLAMAARDAVASRFDVDTEVGRLVTLFAGTDASDILMQMRGQEHETVVP